MRRSSIVVLFIALCVEATFAVPADARRHPPEPATSNPGTSTPAPTPTPLSEELRLERLPGQLQAIAGDAPGTLGIALYDPYRDARIAINGDRNVSARERLQARRRGDGVPDLPTSTNSISTNAFFVFCGGPSPRRESDRGRALRVATSALRCGSSFVRCSSTATIPRAISCSARSEARPSSKQ